MRNLLAVILVSFIFMSCTNYKVATVSSDKAKLVNNKLVFENDTVRITYHFWIKNGAMSFDVYNKLNLPLYFDWKKSAFIPNDKMMSYWQDETNTTGVASSSDYLLYGGSVGRSSVTKSKSIRQERIGVVPPHSIISSNKYSLVTSKTQFPIQEFNLSNTPLQFRNYLAVSTSEQFDKDVIYIDNDFYVSKVIKVKKSSLNTLQSSNAFYFDNFGR